MARTERLNAVEPAPRDFPGRKVLVTPTPELVLMTSEQAPALQPAEAPRLLGRIRAWMVGIVRFPALLLLPLL